MQHPLAEMLMNAAVRIAEQVEIFELSTSETPVNFEANRLKQIQQRDYYSIALRIVKNNKIGYALSNGGASSLLKNKQDSEVVSTLTNMAVETAKFGAPANYSFFQKHDYPQVAIFDQRTENTCVDDMLRLGNEIITKINEHSPEIMCDATVTKKNRRMCISTSRGDESIYRKSTFGASVEGILTNGTDLLFVGDSELSCQVFFDSTALVNRVTKQLDRSRRQASITTKSFPVVFTPRGVVSAFYSPLAYAFNGKAVLEGTSPLQNRMNDIVFSDLLTLYDNPVIDYSSGSIPFDDEGIACRCTKLVDKGIVTNFIYDLQTAAAAQTNSTGNGKRNGAGLPKPGINYFVIEKGNLLFKDMVSGMKEGLVIDELMGAEQGNIMGGDFGGNILLGYKVENGEIVGRVKDAMLSGNIYNVFKQQIEIGNEIRDVDGITRTPPIYCPSLPISTRGG